MASGRGVVGGEQGGGIEKQVERGGKRGSVCGGVCVKRVVESERVVMEGGDAEDSDRRHAVGDACNNGPIRMRCGVIGQYGGD